MTEKLNKALFRFEESNLVNTSDPNHFGHKGPVNDKPDTTLGLLVTLTEIEQIVGFENFRPLLGLQTIPQYSIATSSIPPQVR